MNLFHFRCLEESKWDIKKALTVFTELYKMNKIPPEAFSNLRETRSRWYNLVMYNVMFIEWWLPNILLTFVSWWSKVESKAVLPLPCRQQGGQEYSSYSFLTLALDGGEWSVSHRGHALPLEKEPGTQPLAVWTTELDWTQAGGKILCLCWGFNPDHPVVQSVVRHCTDRATTPALSWWKQELITKKEMNPDRHSKSVFWLELYDTIHPM
jgi:hypothetical protein